MIQWNEVTAFGSMAKYTLPDSTQQPDQTINQ